MRVDCSCLESVGKIQKSGHLQSFSFIQAGLTLCCRSAVSGSPCNVSIFAFFLIVSSLALRFCLWLSFDFRLLLTINVVVIYFYDAQFLLPHFSISVLSPFFVV